MHEALMMHLLRLEWKAVRRGLAFTVAMGLNLAAEWVFCARSLRTGLGHRWYYKYVVLLLVCAFAQSVWLYVREVRLLRESEELCKRRGE